LPPGKETEVIKAIHEKWSLSPPQRLVIVNGDFNQAKFTSVWLDFLVQNNLQLFEPNVHTFQTGETKSTLDGFLLPNELAEGNLQPRLFTYKPPTLKSAGHSILTLSWKAQKPAVKSLAKPTSDAFKATSQPSHQVFNTMKFFEKKKQIDESHFVAAWWNTVKRFEGKNKSALAILKTKLPKQITHITLTTYEEKVISKELGEPINTTPLNGKKQLDL
jgi:hypothetical protein